MRWLAAAALLASCGTSGRTPEEEEAEPRVEYSIRPVASFGAGHASEITGLVTTPDGTRVATADRDGYVRIWDLGQGMEVAALPRLPSRVRSLAISRDGKLAAATFDTFAAVWEIETRRLLRRMDAHPYGANVAAFTPDGKALVTGGNDNRIAVWDIESGRAEKSFAMPELPRDIEIAPDGTRALVTHGDWTVRMWDMAAGTEIRTFRREGVRLLTSRLSPDGSMVAAGGTDGVIHVWEAATGKIVARLTNHTAAVTALAWATGGAVLVSGSRDRTVRSWDVASWQLRHTLRGHADEIVSVAVHPEGAVAVSAGKDLAVRVWDLATGRERYPLTQQARIPRALAWHPDGSLLVSGGEDHVVRWWKMPEGKIVAASPGHHNTVTAAAFSADGARAVTGALDGTVIVWDTTTRKPARILPPYEEGVTAIHVGTHYAAVGTRAGTLSFVDLETGMERSRRAAFDAPVRAIRFHANASMVAAVSEDGFVEAFTVPDWKSAGRFRTGAACTGLDWLEGFEVATSALDGTIRAWSRAGSEIRGAKHVQALTALAGAPDGRHVFTGARDGSLQLWDLTKATLKSSVRAHQAAVTAIAVSADGAFAATAGSDVSLRVWSVTPPVAR